MPTFSGPVRSSWSPGGEVQRMSDDAIPVDCSTHGPALATFVCRHLARGTGRGFNVFDDPDDPYPDAWCDECEAAREQAGGWDEESERVAGISLVCHRCY